MEPLPSIKSAIAHLSKHGKVLPPGRIRVDGYGDTPEPSCKLLALIASGRKRAGTGLLWGYQHDREPIAQAGDLEIVVDHRGAPVLVTRIVSLQVIPFIEVSAEYATIEGEGDGSWSTGAKVLDSFRASATASARYPQNPCLLSATSLRFCMPYPLRAKR